MKPSSRFSHLILSALLLLLLRPPAAASSPAPHHGGALEEKPRLGSTPPSCVNKCGRCRPCMAVQVPAGPALPRPLAVGSVASPSWFPAPAVAGYTDYKPLGWKCECGNRFYNP